MSQIMKKIEKLIKENELELKNIRREMKEAGWKGTGHVVLPYLSEPGLIHWGRLIGEEDILHEMRELHK